MRPGALQALHCHQGREWPTSWHMSAEVRVPDYSDDKQLSASSLILADRVERAVARSGTGTFVIGDTKVFPRVPPSDGSLQFQARTRN